MLLHDLIIETERRLGGRTALHRGDQALDYSTLAQLVETAARGLSSLGVRPGERIGIYLNKRVEGVVTYFAASAAGAVFVPINPLLKPAQVKHILNDCGVTTVVTSAAQAEALASELAECRSLRLLIIIDAASADSPLPGPVQRLAWSDLLAAATPGGALPARRIDNDVAAILYTSGSTGKPKGVVLSHRNMVAGAVSVTGYIGNVPDDVILSALPLSFDAGFSQLTTGFCSGAAVVLLDYLLPQDVLKAVTRFRVTGLTGVPPMWAQLVKSNWPPEASETMRYIANTGGAMPTTTLASLREKLPNSKVFLMYGLTEAFRSTYLPPSEVDARPTSIGKAIPNAEILVVRDDGTPCGPGEPGELVHRGALVALGYWNDEERTATRFRPVPNMPNELPFQEMAVWSGDTVVTDDEGYLYFVGRKDDMIKSSGYRISPTEVEEEVYSTGLVNECAALGIPHAEIGQALVVVAHTRTPNEATADAVISACKRAFPNYMVPARIIWQDALPRNPNGKIDRKRLVSAYSDVFEDS